MRLGIVSTQRSDLQADKTCSHSCDHITAITGLDRWNGSARERPRGRRGIKDPVSIGLDRRYRGNRFETVIAGFKGESVRDVAQEVIVGSLETKNLPIILFSAKDAPELTLIGVEFLERFVFTVDYHRMELILNPVPSKSGSIELFASSRKGE